MRKSVKIAAVLAATIASSAAFADQHAGEKNDKMNAGDAPTMGWMTPGWGLVFPTLSLFDPYLLDIPGGGKGLPVHDAKDTSKIIGYMKMPVPQKPKGPVHCIIKETGLLAKSVDDCEAAGGTVAK